MNSTRGNQFAAALMAARALGFAGYGREKIADPKFNEEYPVLLTTANDPIDEQEARRQINEAARPAILGCRSGKLRCIANMRVAFTA